MPSYNKDRLRKQKTDMTVWRQYFLFGSLSYKCLLCFRARLFIDALWSVYVCLLMPCGHLLGKGWPLGSRLWCLIVSLLLSHWYPGSGVVLDCIDSWSLPSSLLYVFVAAFQTVLRLIDPDDDRPYIYGISTSNQILRSCGDIYERNTCNLGWIV